MPRPPLGLLSVYRWAVRLYFLIFFAILSWFLKKFVSLRNYAKELSKHLENIMIIAPSERISPTQTYGLWGDYNGERILNGGHWNVYKNGKQISSLNSSDVWNQNY